MFINEVIAAIDELNRTPKEYFSKDALTYFEVLRKMNDKDNPTFTKNGKLILDFIQKNHETYNNLFKAKDIGEGLGISSRTASGALRKLVTDGFVEKMGDSPTIYSLTEKGRLVSLEDESD